MRKAALLSALSISTLLSSNIGSFAACAAHEHLCNFHGSGRIVLPDGINPANDGIIAVISWPQAVDVDLHGQLPDNSGPYSTVGTGRLQISSNGTRRLNEPFGGGGATSNNPRHIFYNHHDIAFQNGTALAELSKDLLGNTKNPNPECVDSRGHNCEKITIQGNLPEGVYLFQGYNFNDTENPNPTVNWELSLYGGKNVSVSLDDHRITYSGILNNTGDKTGIYGIRNRNNDFDPHASGVVLRYDSVSEYLKNPYTDADRHISYSDVRFGEIYRVENLPNTQNNTIEYGIANVGEKVIGLPDGYRLTLKEIDGIKLPFQDDEFNRIELNNRFQKYDPESLGQFQSLVNNDVDSSGLGSSLKQFGHVTSGLVDNNGNIIVAAGGYAVGGINAALGITQSNILDGEIRNDTGTFYRIIEGSNSDFAIGRTNLNEKQFFDSYYAISESIGEKFDYEAYNSIVNQFPKIEGSNTCVTIGQQIYENAGLPGSFTDRIDFSQLGGSKAAGRVKTIISQNDQRSCFVE